MHETPMDGSVQLAFARDPSFFHAAAVEGDTQTVLAREPDGRVVALFSRSVRPCWVSGAVRPLSYLSALRIAPEYRARRTLLQTGFRWVRQLRDESLQDLALPYAITTIISDNAPARRLLEANLPGLPLYRPRQEMITLAAPTWRRRYREVHGVEIRAAREEDIGEIAAILERCARRTAFTPYWSEPILRDPERTRDLSLGDFSVALRGKRCVGCVALWDQGRFKQSVVHGYRGALAWTRRVVNLAAPLLGIPRLPAAGEALRHAYLSHLAVEDFDADVARALVGFAHDRAIPERYGYLTTMLAGANPLLPALMSLLRPMQYRSMLYLVGWEEADFASIPEETPHLEVAVL